MGERIHLVRLRIHSRKTGSEERMQKLDKDNEVKGSKPNETRISSYKRAELLIVIAL